MFLLGLAVLGGPSCTAVLGLDAFQSAPAALCDKLSVCYADGAPPACQERIAGRLAGNPGSDQSWLHDFSAKTCLLDCTSARRCLDLTPLCANAPDACEVREQCCGFLTGVADCVGGHCCAASGQHCGDISDCCSNAGDCVKGTCGGRVCQLAKGPCRVDADCCTMNCVDFACAATICNDNGFECGLDSDCCSSHCESTKRCGDSCVAESGPCRADRPCCGGLMCFIPPGATGGVCSTSACLPEGVECVAGLPCCDGLSCDATLQVCAKACVADGSACAAAGECCSGSCSSGLCAKPACSEAYCATDGDCCSGTCLSSTCKASCQPNPPCHDLCTDGGPLGKSCTGAELACVTAVCAKDAYCCCSGWDTLCISHVAALALQAGPCAGACP